MHVLRIEKCVVIHLNPLFKLPVFSYPGMAQDLVTALGASLSPGAAPAGASVSSSSSSSSVAAAARGALGSIMAMCPVAAFEAVQAVLGGLLDRKEHDALSWQVWMVRN